MGKDYKPCKFFQNVYKDFCPNFWVEKWDELVEEGPLPRQVRSLGWSQLLYI
ncbi:hypothetical protein OSTOST_24583 [Ostertagia ostertagi]